MQKKMARNKNTSLKQDNPDRDTQILNIINNTTILLVSMMTEAMTNVFTTLSKEMMTAMSKGFGAPEESAKDIQRTTDDLERKIPEELHKQLHEMKTDITKQMNEKKEQIAPLLSDKRFDRGIEIVQRYEFNLPRLTCDLDERSLLGYLALLNRDDEQFTKMFKELLEWMNNLPQQEKIK